MRVVGYGVAHANIQNVGQGHGGAKIQIVRAGPWCAHRSSHAHARGHLADAFAGIDDEQVRRPQRLVTPGVAVGKDVELEGVALVIEPVLPPEFTRRDEIRVQNVARSLAVYALVRVSGRVIAGIDVAPRPEMGVVGGVGRGVEAEVALLVAVLGRRDVCAIGVDVVDTREIADADGSRDGCLCVLDRGLPQPAASLDAGGSEKEGNKTRAGGQHVAGDVEATVRGRRQRPRRERDGPGCG